MRWRSCFLVLALLPSSVLAQVGSDSIITVTATRNARIAPDRASVYVFIEGSAETAAGAVARAEAKVKGVSDALRAPETRVEAERPIAYSVGPTPNMNGFPVAATPTSHVARTVIRVHVTRPELVANTIAAALDAGASNTSSVTFESTAADSVRRTRMAEALTAARLDAESIARALGGRLGPLVGVTSTSGGGPQQPSVFSFDGRFGQQGTAPEVTVTTSVTVRYRLLR